MLRKLRPWWISATGRFFAEFTLKEVQGEKANHCRLISTKISNDFNRQARLESGKWGRGFDCYVFADEVDMLCGAFKARGSRIVEELADKPWGYREFTLEDVNGHIFHYFRGSEALLVKLAQRPAPPPIMALSKFLSSRFLPVVEGRYDPILALVGSGGPQEWPEVTQLLYPLDVRAALRSISVDRNPMVSKVDCRQNKVWIVIDEQAFRRRESQSVAPGPVHSRIGLTAPHCF
jgi:hypothetical protein